MAQHPIPQQAPQFLRLVWLWSWLTTLEESLVETGPDTVSTVRALPSTGGAERPGPDRDVTAT